MVRQIDVDLYNWHLKGSLDMCLMIAQETECSYDGGVWNGPFHFLPESEAQREAVLDLVNHFELRVVS